jgi:SRSO17 transposase
MRRVFLKVGRHSAGVKRQCTGTAGRIENYEVRHWQGWYRHITLAHAV